MTTKVLDNVNLVMRADRPQEVSIVFFDATKHVAARVSIECVRNLAALLVARVTCTDPAPAVARGVSRDPVDGHPVISFDVAGSIVRYRLTEDSAAFLRGALGDLDQIGRRSHSDRSSGNPTSDVSTPFEGVKV